MDNNQNMNTVRFIRAVGDGKSKDAKTFLEKVLREKAAKRIKDILGR